MADGSGLRAQGTGFGEYNYIELLTTELRGVSRSKTRRKSLRVTQCKISVTQWLEKIWDIITS
jgi:hypothetical protein